MCQHKRGKYRIQAQHQQNADNRKHFAFIPGRHINNLCVIHDISSFAGVEFANCQLQQDIEHKQNKQNIQVMARENPLKNWRFSQGI